MTETTPDAPIEERALRAILGNQVLIMRALARLISADTPHLTFAAVAEADALTKRAEQTEEWKNANLRN